MGIWEGDTGEGNTGPTPINNWWDVPKPIERTGLWNNLKQHIIISIQKHLLQDKFYSGCIKVMAKKEFSRPPG